jgi:hypothetical protein
MREFDDRLPQRTFDNFQVWMLESKALVLNTMPPPVPAFEHMLMRCCVHAACSPQQHSCIQCCHLLWSWGWLHTPGRILLLRPCSCLPADTRIPLAPRTPGQFVELTSLVAHYRNAPPGHMEAAFALRALMEIPQQYKVGGCSCVRWLRER